MIVSEIFGPTFQGEGPSLGRPCIFLRLGGCPVQCHWCDTAYTWDGKNFDLKLELEVVDVQEVEHRLQKQYSAGPADMLVVAGGEPMSQQDELLQLIKPQTLFRSIEIETSGHVSCNWSYMESRLVNWNVSPKLGHAKVRLDYKFDTLFWYRDVGARFKFVVEKVSDFEEIDEIIKGVGIPPQMVYIMPLGIDRHDLVVRSQTIADETIKRGFNLTTRLHILLYGNKRGV